MEIRRISPGVMEEFIAAEGKERPLSVQGTTVYVVGSSAPLEQRTGASGILFQSAGGFRKAKRRSSAIEEECWWIIKDPPGVEKGHYLVGPVSRKSLSLA